MTADETGLRAVGVEIGYGGAAVVSGLDFAPPPRAFTALLGPNGCGKSTILRALARLHPPRRGAVLLDGADLSALGAKAAARRLGLLAQGATAPEGMTVADLARQGRYPHRRVFGGWSEADQAALEEALALTSMTGLAERPLDALSGGQRQRAWIAMVLTQQPDILLLDEPTTYLDLAHQLDLMTLIRRLVDERGLTVIAILHDLNQAARHADHLALLRAGRIIAQGKAAEVVTPALIAEAFGVEIALTADPEDGAPLCIPRRTLPATERASP